MKFRVLIFLIALATGNVIFAQSDLYDIGEVKNVRLYFQQPDWDAQLDSLYVLGDEQRIMASLVINGTRFDSVGVRYKGFSSVSVERKKNPFNIKLDYVRNQSYQGYEKIKLSNVIQDPSFVREALTYEIARKYMVASKANFANLYINDTFWGVYTNVEAINKQFLADRFTTKDNALFKANPEDLDLNGENSNLNNLFGMDSAKYIHLYDLKSDFGWRDLMDFMSILNDSIEKIESILNVDQTLWMHALNYTLVNFDSYIGYAQNYYLYKRASGQFYPLIWDLNQSFGSFRLTDASTFFRGFTVEESQNLDPLAHVNSFSVHPRPLLRKLLENDRYKRMYLAHIRTILSENIANEAYLDRAEEMQTLIQSDVYKDENKFYANADFKNNLSVTVKDLISYPGIEDLMSNRYNYLTSVKGVLGGPVLSSHKTNEQADSIDISVVSENSDRVIVYYEASENEAFKHAFMFDDGNHSDGRAGDNNYGIRLDMSEVSAYYFYAENDSAGSFLPARAAHEFFTLTTENDFIINEICAANSSILADENGDFDDWIELYNNSSQSINQGGFYLSDDNDNLLKWQLPSMDIESGGYALFWLDNETEEGDDHGNFKLSSAGETVYLSNSLGEIVDQVSFGPQTTDLSYGRIANGVGGFVTTYPTPWQKNEAASEEDIPFEFVLYPNPSQHFVRVLFETKTSGEIEIHHINGSLVTNSISIHDSWAWDYNVSEMVKGIYFLTITTDNHVKSKKFIVN